MAGETAIQVGEAVSAWADINPAMALAPRPEPRSQSLARLQPATSDEFRNELTACLALVVPVGMTEEARREWLTVAWATLKHLPADLLSLGCVKARQACDHPSKIVPTVVAETEALMRARWDTAREDEHPQLPPPKDLLAHRGQPMSEAETTELNAILEGLGATARYRPDGSRYVIGEAA